SRGEAVLDHQARPAQKKRLPAIDTEIADAEAHADLGRPEEARVERACVIAELTPAAGARGRSRRLGADSERGRTAVPARARHAARRSERVSPGLGEHSRGSVRTGTFCSYGPVIDVHWQL